MRPFENPSAADQVDNHRRLLFLAMFLLSLIYAIKTASFIVDQGVADYLGIVAKGLAGLFLIVLLVLAYWKVRFIPKDERYLLASLDSYVMHVLNRACLISWFSTFALLSLMMTTTSHNSSAFPAEFYLNLTLFLMLAVFSLSFFFLLRASGKHELEQG